MRVWQFIVYFVVFWKVIYFASIDAQEFSDLGTDRDAFTPSTFTIMPGQSLIEGSYVFIDNRTTPPTNSYPELLCRCGATDRFEWRFGVSYVENAGGYLVTNAEGSEGRGDGTVAYESNVLFGFKAITTEQSGWIPQSCVIVEGFTPTSGDLFGTAPVPTVAIGWKLANEWRLDTAIRYVYAEGSEGWFNKWSPSIVLRLPVTERWEVHGEFFSTTTDGLPHEKTSSFLSPGTHFILAKNLELGLRVGWGITNDAAHFFSDAGFGYRF